MSQSYSKKAEGVAVVTMPYGDNHEVKTVTCGHCQLICLVEAGTDGTGSEFAEPVTGLIQRKRPGTHVCHICWRLVCDKCHHIGTCTPWEEKLKKMEQRADFLRSAGLL